MSKQPVVFSPEARDDLRQLSIFIAERSGATRALAYLGRIEACCLGPGDFPERGTSRDDFWPGCARPPSSDGSRSPSRLPPTS